MAYQEKRVRRSREIPKHCWTRLMIYIKLERHNFFFWTLLQLLYCKGSSPNLWDWKTVLLQMTCEQYNLPFGSIENYHMLFLYFIMLLKTPALKLIRKKNFGHITTGRQRIYGHENTKKLRNCDFTT